MTHRLSKLVLENQKAGERLEIGYMGCYFADGLARLRELGFEPITAAELMEARMVARELSREDTSFLYAHEMDGVSVGENYNFLPTGDLLVASRGLNPLLVGPNSTAYDIKARQNHPLLLRSPVLGLEERANRDLTRARQSGVLHVPKAELRRVYSLDALTSEPLFAFLFGDNAGMIRDFLRDERVREIDHRYNDYSTAGYHSSYICASPLFLTQTRGREDGNRAALGNILPAKGFAWYAGMKKTPL